MFFFVKGLLFLPDFFFNSVIFGELLNLIMVTQFEL